MRANGCCLLFHLCSFSSFIYLFFKIKPRSFYFKVTNSHTITDKTCSRFTKSNTNTNFLTSENLFLYISINREDYFSFMYIPLNSLCGNVFIHAEFSFHLFTYLFLAALGLHPAFVVSRGYCLVAVCGLLIAECRF